MVILGIETSCDETAAAVVQVTRGRFVVKSNVVSSQIKIHRRYGGVVPEVAARNHIIKIIPVIQAALVQAGVSLKKIDRLAVTIGPGLISALIVGIQTAKTIAAATNIPIVEVNHMCAHLYSGLVENKPIKFPALGLIVSGGHTELIVMRDKTTIKKIGQTIDDAAGEAFDKVAALLGLPYPGGPEISERARQGRINTFNFPRPLLDRKDSNFSFSGLKTAVRYRIEKRKLTTAIINDVCASFQQAVVDVLVAKTMAAAKKYKCKTILVTGGVAANSQLRVDMQQAAKVEKIPVIFPPLNVCTDNAAMIAVAGFFEKPAAWQKIAPNANLEIK